MNDLNQQLTARFESLTDKIRNAIQQTHMGEAVNLGDLEKNVAKLCTDVSKAGNDTKRAMQQPMAEMIARLDELAHGLKEYQDRLKG